MEVTKFGHCCLLIKIDGLTVLTDPGTFSTSQAEARGVDLILITHEHADHLHSDSLKQVLANNPGARVFTNSAVGRILEGESITHEILEGQASAECNGVSIVACDGKHEEIFEEVGQVQNTGYLIAERFFYPGDSFTAPGKPVDVLALPAAGPWAKMPEVIRYCLQVKPRVAFPVHDGMLKPDKLGLAHGAPSRILPERGIAFIPLTEGATHTFE